MRNKVYFEALDLLSNNLNLQTTYFLILHANEGDEWPANFEFGHSDPSPPTPMAAQNAGSKSSARPINWGAICPIEIGRNLAELYIKIMHQSIPAAPIPPPGNCGAFARIVSPGGRALAYPRATPGLLTHVVSDSKSKRRRFYRKRPVVCH